MSISPSSCLLDAHTAARDVDGYERSQRLTGLLTDGILHRSEVIQDTEDQDVDTEAVNGHGDGVDAIGLFNLRANGVRQIAALHHGLSGEIIREDPEVPGESRLQCRQDHRESEDHDKGGDRRGYGGADRGRADSG